MWRFPEAERQEHMQSQLGRRRILLRKEQGDTLPVDIVVVGVFDDVHGVDVIDTCLPVHDVLYPVH